MEKKSSVGLKIVSVVSILAGLLIFKLSLSHFIFVHRLDYIANMHLNSIAILILIFGLAYIVAGVFILLLKDWARKLLLFLMLAYLIFGLYSIAGHFSIEGKPLYNDIGYLIVVVLCFVLPSIVVFYYFTRLKVKEQFKDSGDRKA